LRTSGCLKLLFPQTQEPAMTAVQLNTAGGITGGDHLMFAAQAEEQSHLRLTTQAAERIYRSVDGRPGTVETSLTVAAGARLDWLPQETILFDHSSLRRSMRVDLAHDARLFMVEPLIFGRAAMGEVLTQVSLRDSWRIYRDNTLIFADALRFERDLNLQMKRPAIGDGAGAMMTALFAAPANECEALLAQIRPMLSETAGASLLRPDLLVLRALAEDGFCLRRDMIPTLTLLNGAELPRTWMI
jgi:urease accessory protein